ncbi:hypothetical protein [Streptacidiphilus monticola]|uniref:Uncharacterized protein n=1 Tax=Streptacidiphilus monticola TaxID=2161674 RepID=A0ABW1G3B5_9ACTN
MAKKNASSSAAAARRARIAAERAADRRRERRNRLLVRAGLGAAALAVVGGGIAIAADRGSSSGSGSAAGTGAARWAVPADASVAVTSAGLPMLSTEGTVLHLHTHLDVYVDGKQVQVPAEIGIDQATQQISPLHSHDTSGVIHIESPEKKDFTLGQFLKEWQVPLSTSQLGDLKTDATHTLIAYVNGRPASGDPASIVLRAHDEIALVYGTASENAAVQVPSGYHWTDGL